MGIKGLIAGFVFERPAKTLTLAQLAANLGTTGQRIEQGMASADDTPANREKARHVIGIERWGQSRLQIALGEQLVMDEYDGYRPSPDLDLRSLQAEFHAARQDTIALAQKIEEAGAGDRLVLHNDFGDLSVRGWLQYLGGHASLESKRIK